MRGSHWRADYLGSLDVIRDGGTGAAAAPPPPPPTLLLGESNDGMVVEALCTRCGAPLVFWLKEAGVDTGTIDAKRGRLWGCDCGGWVVASAWLPGVSRAPPFHLAVDQPVITDPRSPRHGQRNPYYRPGLPADWHAAMPVLAAAFQRFFRVAPKRLVLHAGSWDSSRACLLPRSGGGGADAGGTSDEDIASAAAAWAAAWASNASSLVGRAREVFGGDTPIFWRVANRLSDGTHASCAQQPTWHNLLPRAAVDTFGGREGVTLLRWDRFVEAAAGEEKDADLFAIHPPVRVHEAWANLLANVLGGDAGAACA